MARSAIESAAENLSDGVVAPAFWFLVMGLARHPPVQDHQHRRQHDRLPHPRHAAFGWAAARLDDVLNWVPARLTAAMIRPDLRGDADWRGIAADARRHRSPNAGWPEAAMARADRAGRPAQL